MIFRSWAGSSLIDCIVRKRTDEKSSCGEAAVRFLCPVRRDTSAVIAGPLPFSTIAKALSFDEIAVVAIQHESGAATSMRPALIRTERARDDPIPVVIAAAHGS